MALCDCCKTERFVCNEMQEQYDMMTPAERMQLEEEIAADAIRDAVRDWEEQQARSAEDGA